MSFYKLNSSPPGFSPLNSPVTSPTRKSPSPFRLPAMSLEFPLDSPPGNVQSLSPNKRNFAQLESATSPSRHKDFNPTGFFFLTPQPTRNEFAFRDSLRRASAPGSTSLSRPARTRLLKGFNPLFFNSAKIRDQKFYVRGQEIQLFGRNGGQQHMVYFFKPSENLAIDEKRVLKEGNTYILKQASPSLDSQDRARILKDDIKLFEQFKADGINHPAIYLRPDETIDPLDPKNSGFWILEAIPFSVDTELFKNANNIDELPKNYLELLKFIRSTFERAAKGEAVLTDLRPCNVMLREDGTYCVIDAVLPNEDSFEILYNLQHGLKDWSLGNQVIFDFLTENFSITQKAAVSL